MAKQKSRYLESGRLADVLALIQVLALDPYAHRSGDGLQSDLKVSPASAATWIAVAQEHPEFFRVDPDAKRGICLVARHVVEVDENRKRDLPPEFVSQLLGLAVELHDREVRRSEAWHVWVPALVTGAFTVVAALIGGYLAALAAGS